MKILFINACVRKESRTLLLANELLSGLRGEIIEVFLPSLNLKPLDEKMIYGLKINQKDIIKLNKIKLGTRRQ